MRIPWARHLHRALLGAEDSTDELLTRLRDSLVPAAERAFGQMRADHAGERFYCMALYTCGDLAYVITTGMTEEGLDAAVEEYRKKLPYSVQPIDATQRMLRWNPCDSPLHGEGRDAMAPAQGIVGEVSDRLMAFDPDEDSEAFDALSARIDDTLCDVLAELDRRGAFGTGPEREQIVVTVMMGDQDDSILEYARRANPDAVYRRFEREWRAAFGAV